MKNRIPNNKRKLNLVRGSLAAAALGTVMAIHPALGQSSGDNWKTLTISPVANPIYFEDPQIDSEVRPIFFDHRLPDTFHYQGGTTPLGGDIKVVALQLRYAMTERLALIANKDGYIMSEPDHIPHGYGWGNIAAGLKYALVDDKQNQFILTPGFTIELPTGNESVFQGRGAGLWNLFASAEKGWQNFHVTGNAGFLIPDDFSSQTAQAHYSLQLDYHICTYFIPFITGNGYTVLTDGNTKLLGAVPLNTELYDLSDFGSSQGESRTQITLGAGFHSRLYKCLDLGFAYEFGATTPQGIFKDRFTTDVIWRF